MFTVALVMMGTLSGDVDVFEKYSAYSFQSAAAICLDNKDYFQEELVRMGVDDQIQLACVPVDLL